MTHLVLKCYIILARGEQYEPRDSEAMLARQIETDEPEHAQHVWYAGRWLDQVCEARGITPDEVYEMGIINKPSFIANLIYSDKLKRTFGDLNLSGFENNVYQLPKGQGVLFPIRLNGKITDLKFYPMSKILQRKAA
jgi:hypothetical protein